MANERETTRRQRNVMTGLCDASLRRRHLMAYKNVGIIYVKQTYSREVHLKTAERRGAKGMDKQQLWSKRFQQQL